MTFLVILCDFLWYCVLRKHIFYKIHLQTIAYTYIHIHIDCLGQTRNIRDRYLKIIKNVSSLFSAQEDLFLLSVYIAIVAMKYFYSNNSLLMYKTWPMSNVTWLFQGTSNNQLVPCLCSSFRGNWKLLVTHPVDGNSSCIDIADSYAVVIFTYHTLSLC